MSRQHIHPRRRDLLAAGVAAGVLAASGPARAQSGEPVLIGVSGPLTGQYAQYGAQWRRGFDMAVAECNASGGINGRPLAYVFEDSQSDPRQSVAIAQKFVADPRIVMEIGDFASAASMAASPIYQRGRLVQFGFTNSHPDFTKGGDYMWTNAPDQAEDMPNLSAFAVAKVGMKKLGVLYIDSDWGRTSETLFATAAKQDGAAIAAAEAYLASEQDFRPTLVRVRDAAPDGIVLISYYPDGAQIVRQLRQLGMTQKVVAAGSVYSPKFLELGGAAVDGVLTMTNFFPGDPRPEVRDFVKRYREKFGEGEPDAYVARAWDAMTVAMYALRAGGPTREGVHAAMATISDVPSLVYGRMRFDVATRRVRQPAIAYMAVRDGRFVAWQG
jgi:branched-chain amino acid transport system substrate-binding protein